MARQEALIEILESMRAHLYDRVHDDINELLEYVSKHKEYGLLERKYGISTTYKEFLDKVNEAIREVKEKEDGRN